MKKGAIKILQALEDVAIDSTGGLVLAMGYGPDMVAHSARDDGVIELARLCKQQGKIVLPIDSTMDSSDGGICHTQHCTGTK